MANASTGERQDGHQTQQADNRYTRKIAQFVSGLTYEKIPAEVTSRIKLLILDSLGCGIYGSLPEHSKILINTLAGLDSSKTCGVWDFAWVNNFLPKAGIPAARLFFPRRRRPPPRSDCRRKRPCTPWASPAPRP